MPRFLLPEVATAGVGSEKNRVRSSEYSLLRFPSLDLNNALRNAHYVKGVRDVTGSA